MDDSVPLVSVVLPSFNHEAFVGAALESLIAQTYEPIELILVDDGSSDRSREVIEALRYRLEERFRRVVLRYREKNIGLSATMNEIIEEARGEFLFYFSSDDIALPWCIETLIKTTRSDLTEPALVCGEAELIDGSGAKAYVDRAFAMHRTPAPDRCDHFVEHFLRLRRVPVTNENFGTHSSLLFGNYIPVGPLLRTDLARKAGPYPVGRVLDDHYFWLQLSRFGRFRFVDQVLTKYRIHGKNTSRTRVTSIHGEAIQMIIGQKDYCTQVGSEEAWANALASLVSVRRPGDFGRAIHAGISPKRIVRSLAQRAASRVWRRLTSWY